jgi:hypothetical protein
MCVPVGCTADRSRALDTCPREKLPRILALVFDTPIDPEKA